MVIRTEFQADLYSFVELPQQGCLTAAYLEEDGKSFELAS